MSPWPADLPDFVYSLYDIRGLSPSVDAFDVMAYDITSPGSAFAGPVAPLNGMTYADTNTVKSYSPPLPPGEMFPGWDITRGLTVEPTGQGGLVLNGWGGLHPFGDSPGAAAQSYWPGWDIARAVATAQGGGAGYVLDGWGGVHPFSVGSSALPPQAHGGSYWPGWDIARAMTLLPDGSGGLVLDGLGGLHPFTSAGVVASPVVTGYWSNWDIARGVVLLPNSSGSSYAGYVLDGWGGLHPFASRGRALPAAPVVSGYWPGYDIARGLTMIPGTAMGYVVDGLGGFWPFDGAPSVQSPNYGIAGATVRSPAAA